MGAVVFCGALLAAACSRGPGSGGGSRSTGTVAFALHISSSVEITVVDYQITGNGITPIPGRIDVSNTMTARAVATGIPAGNDYTLDLTAYSTDMKTRCTGSAMFNIDAGTTAQANVVMQCRPYSAPQGTGGASMDGGVDMAPDAARDAAAGTGGVGGGASGMLGGASGVGSGGVVGSGGTSSGGAGGMAGGPGGQGTAGKGGMGGSAGGSAGAGGLAGAGGRGGAGGGAGMGGSAGSGLGGGAGAGGSGPGGAGGVGGGAGGGGGIGGSGAGSGGAAGAGGAGGACAPTHCRGATCEQCQMDNCSKATDGCDLLGDPAAKALCEELYACFVNPANNCLIAGNQGDAIPCWCGTNPTTCVTASTGPTKANGPCLDLVTRGAGLTAATYDAPTIKSLLINPNYPLGRAINLASCEGQFCNAECAIP